MTARGRAVAAAGCLLWVGAVVLLAALAATGRPALWPVVLAAVGSAGVGFAACGLLNHSP